MTHPDRCHTPAQNTVPLTGDRGDRLIADAELLSEGLHPDPFSVLGRHICGEQSVIRVFLPGAQSVRLADIGQSLQRLANTDLFEWRGVVGDALPQHYRVVWIDAAGCERTIYDPYSFSPQISLYDLHLFNEGRHLHIYRVLGSHVRVVNGIAGVLFAVWAPHAAHVNVVGDFNDWCGSHHPLRRRGGVWELFIPGLMVGMRYQYSIAVRETGAWLRKSDPYGCGFEQRPATATLIVNYTPYQWGDAAWMAKRRKKWERAPLAVYEVHLGSWQRGKQGGYLSYEELARRLVAYVGSLGFTHIELMPITEHPLDASWGYQPTGFFAPTSRHGDIRSFCRFVDYCHQAGIGVILDWVPGHFPKDDHGLAQFDGTYLYEYEDPERREQRGWGTLAFNYGRTQVKNFLLASACFWLEECHLDGLRVDAVASMLYLDYARDSDEWMPNLFGGNENLEAIAFLRELNDIVSRRYPSVLMIAEESTAWPLVTRPAWMGGLGFGMKWNMGWMHDTLDYIGSDPGLRRYHHDLLTFGLLYAFTENFMLPLSHDEVVHSKGSLFSKMPGDEYQRFANLRLLYVYMWTYPGKKLLFMGGEFAQEREWNHDYSLDWDLLGEAGHFGVQRLVHDLNFLYCSFVSLHDKEFAHEGFEWLDCHDARCSIIAYLRRGCSEDDLVVVVLNLSVVDRLNYRVGVPVEGCYREVLNSDGRIYGGGGAVHGDIFSSLEPCMGHPYSLLLNLPPLTGVVFSFLKH